jgi:hypothetical protein
LKEIISTRDMKTNEIRKIENYMEGNNFEFLLFKIFEVISVDNKKYLSKSLTFHFERCSKHILKKEEMYLSSIKFKNMYIIDLHTQEIIFDMMSMRVKLS